MVTLFGKLPRHFSAHRQESAARITRLKRDIGYPRKNTVDVNPASRDTIVLNRKISPSIYHHITALSWTWLGISLAHSDRQSLPPCIVKRDSFAIVGSQVGSGVCDIN